MSKDFEKLADGARRVRVQLEKGDVVARAGEGESWRLEWTSAEGDSPEIERAGDVLRIRQRPGGFMHKRLDLRLTMPRGVEGVELRTGLGKVDAEGLSGRSTLKTGNGPLSVRSSQGETSASTGNGEVAIQGYTGDIAANTGNGRTRIEGLRGEAKLNTGNGQVDMLDCEGRVRATTGNGEVVLSGVGGEVELNTGHGEIEIRAPRSLAVRASTAMGSVRIEGGSVRGLRINSMLGGVRCTAMPEPGVYELSTAMGDVLLGLPAGVRARVDAQTGFGQVRSDFPLVRVGRSGPMGFGGVRMVGSIGEGDPDVDVSLRSAKGQITLRLISEDAAAVGAQQNREAPSSPGRPAESAPGAGTARRARGWSLLEKPPTAQPGNQQADGSLAILEAVARGELTPDEADELLSRQG